jgi:pimeloyl-ACP methyl ester carboxylesterase
MVLGGSLDLIRPPGVIAEYARLFPAARLVVQPGAGHYPWLDDAACFVSAVTGYFGLTAS